VPSFAQLNKCSDSVLAVEKYHMRIAGNSSPDLPLALSVLPDKRIKHVKGDVRREFILGLAQRGLIVLRDQAAAPVTPTHWDCWTGDAFHVTAQDAQVLADSIETEERRLADEKARTQSWPRGRQVFSSPYPSWLAWEEGKVGHLAHGILGAAGNGFPPALHDALLDAGCDDQRLVDAVHSHNRADPAASLAAAGIVAAVTWAAPLGLAVEVGWARPCISVSVAACSVRGWRDGLPVFGTRYPPALSSQSRWRRDGRVLAAGSLPAAYTQTPSGVFPLYTRADTVAAGSRRGSARP
jgi:hypothetical protein